MYIYNIFDDSSVRNAVVEALKTKGVKFKQPKRSKTASVPKHSSNIFNVPLSQLPKATVSLKDGHVMAEVPRFLSRAILAIENEIVVEGIFRKGGSASKQRELREHLNSGLDLPPTCHVIDVCNIVKLFLRELPEPLIPKSFHEAMLSCLLLSGEMKQQEALLLTCLLLPRDNITVLSFLLEFLCKTASFSSRNKMDTRNLAIVITPSLMQINEKSVVGTMFNLNHYISLVEMLIVSAEKIGIVDGQIEEVARNSKTRKRRSASINRVFTGIKKMVGRGSPLRDIPALLATPATPEGRAGQKRKSQEVMPQAVTVKRRREMAETTPQMCRMRGYSAGTLPSAEEADCPELPFALREAQTVQTKKGRLRQGLKTSKSSSSLLTKKALERKLSRAWGRRRSSFKEVEKTADASCSPATREDELVTIPRREYEELLRGKTIDTMTQIAINTEPDQLAEKLQDELKLEWTSPTKPEPTSSLNAVVEVAFQRTMEQTEQLAPQIRRDVKLRWSTEKRVVRSPSQRKIGSIRRRSKEMERTSRRPKSNIVTRSNSTSNADRCQITAEDENWQPAISVLASSHLAHLRDSPKKRDSIASLRRNNNGMVQAKAKFFDSLNYSDNESDKSVNSMERKLKCVQAEMRQSRAMRQQLKENRQPVIKIPLSTSTTCNMKTPRSCTRSAVRPRATPLKALPDQMNTPLRNVRRSPRILARAVSFRSPNHAT